MKNRKKILGVSLVIIFSLIVIGFGVLRVREDHHKVNLCEKQSKEEEKLVKALKELGTTNEAAAAYKGYVQLLKDYPKWQQGDELCITYDFESDDLKTLKEKYYLEKIAGTGSEFEKAVRLMDYFSGRLAHEPNYDNHVNSNALDLLAYCLDNHQNGINCRAKSKILCEMCLSLGIYARCVWLMPYDPQDMDCHVVIEVYDHAYEKWIMLDMTNDSYYIDEDNKPLSVLEIRQYNEEGKLCSAIQSSQKDQPENVFKTNISLNQYIAKNMFYFIVEDKQGFGEQAKEKYYLVPEQFDVKQREIKHLEASSKWCQANGTQEDIAYCKEQIKTLKQTTLHFISADALEKAPQ